MKCNIDALQSAQWYDNVIIGKEIGYSPLPETKTALAKAITRAVKTYLKRGVTGADADKVEIRSHPNFGEYHLFFDGVFLGELNAQWSPFAGSGNGGFVVHFEPRI